MHGSVRCHVGFSLVLMILVAAQGGCASPAGGGMRSTLSDLPKLRQREIRAALRSDVTQFLDYAEAEITTAAGAIEDSAADSGVRRAALLWKVEIVKQAGEDRSSTEPLALLLDIWAFCTRLTNYLERGEGKDLFKDQQRLAVSAAVRLRDRIAEIARTHLPEDKLPPMIRDIEAYARANPIRGTFAHEVAQDFSSGNEGKGVLTRLIGTPWQALTKASKDALDPTTRVSQAVDRFTALMEDYPSLVRWQTQLLWLQLEESKSVQATVRGIEDLSKSSVRLASVAEELPQQVRGEVQVVLDDFVASQPEIRRTLEEARATVDAVNASLERAESISSSIERSLDQVTRAGETWQATAEAVTGTVREIQKIGRRNEKSGGGEALGQDKASQGARDTDGGRRRFDVNEYTRTAEALTRSTEEIRGLLSELTAIFEDETQILSRVDSLAASALGRTSAEARAVIDHTSWRAVQICGLIFVLALGYRFVAARLVPR